MAARVFTTAGVNNLWSNAANWDGGLTIPADTDSFTIPNGQTCEFDVDQSAWAGMAASTIAAGGTLIATTTAGAYVLKMNADLTVNGTLQAGTSVAVPYPATCTFTINFSSGSNSLVISNTTGVLKLYCLEPTNRWVTTTAQETIGEHEIAVDTDVSTDIWTVGDKVIITDLLGSAAGTTRDTEEFTIAQIDGGASPVIHLSGNLTAQKEIGAKLILVQRNIRLINSTDMFVKNGQNLYIAAECYNCSSISSILNATASGLQIGTTYGGVICLNNVAGQIAITTFNSTINSVITQVAGTNYATGVVGANNIISDDSLISGIYRSCYNSYNTTFNGEISACGYGISNCFAINVNGPIKGCERAFSNCFDVSSTGDISNVYYFGVGIDNIIIGNCTIGVQIGGVVSATGLYLAMNGKMYNVALNTTTEFSGYNSTSYRKQNDYFESFDHDQSINAYKAWCLGGIVTSQTASPPTGYTIYYDHEVESATYPCFRQYQATVLPGTAIEVSAVIRNTDGIDVSATTPIDLRPRLEIIDVFADPLVDSTQSALDSDPIAVSDGSNTDWQDVGVIWANTGDSPRQVYVRIICYSHDASTHTIDEAWSIASYQEQIAAMYNSMIPLRTDVATANTATSFTLTAGTAATNVYRHNTLTIQDSDDGHWEQRKITSWTSGRVVTVDNPFTFTPAVGDLCYILSAGYGASMEETIKRIKRLAPGGEI